MYDRLKGFRDFYPGEMAARRAVVDTIEAVAEGYGYREVGTPALERTAMYVEKSGPEIVDQLYRFTDHGGRDVSLTPELTPTVARMVTDRGQALAKPIKWRSTRPFWRYEQVQQGRFREFYQTNVDVIGATEPAADAEIIAVAADALTALGLTEADFVFRVSHRDILGALLRSIEERVDVGAAIRVVDKRARVDEDEYIDGLVDAGLSRADAREFDDVLQAGDEDLDALLAAADSDALVDAVENLRAVLIAAEDYGVREHCNVSLSTARGLDYYTGVVFECFDTTGEISRSVFGGGRYDELVESFGGPATPAVGVAFGVMNSTLPLLLQRAGVFPEEVIATDYYVLQAGETRPQTADVARQLRERGHVVETDVTGRGFGSQLEYADAINAETVVIVGERDLAEDAVTVKDMATGNQVQVPIASFPGDHERPTYVDFA